MRSPHHVALLAAAMLALAPGSPGRGQDPDKAGDEARLVIQTGHKGALALAFSADGRCVLSGSDDQTAQLWDAQTGKELVAFEGHTGPVTSVALSPDGRLALTGSEDRTARLWDLVTDASRPLAGHTDKVVFAGFSADGRRLIVVDHLAQIATHYDDLPRNELGLRAWLAQVAHDVRAR